LLPAGEKQGLAAAHSFELLTREVAQTPQILGADIGQFVPLQVSPEIFHRVQLRGVGGKSLDGDASLLACDELFDQRGGRVTMKGLVAGALKYRFVVLIATALVAVFGVFSLGQLPIDAVPDITPNQVLVLTKAPSLSPIEIEQYLTFPVESAMTGLPGVTRIQSVSKNGISYVAIYFKDNMDVYRARQLVSERLVQAKESGQYRVTGDGTNCDRTR
jgi:hypothetical protein